MANLARPTFVELFLENTIGIVRDRGALYIFPWWIVSFSIIGEIIARYVAAKAFDDLAISVPIYVGFLTFNGLLLALSWGAFSRIYESLCSSAFSKYLRDTGLFSTYLYHIMYVHATQIASVIFSSAGLLLTISTGVHVSWQRWLFGFVFAFGAYAVKEACGAVTIMNDLIWYRAIFDADLDTKSNIKSFPVGR